MKIIGQLPSKLSRIIFRAGRRKVVLVEGEDDVLTFESWFHEYKSRILFYECGGKTKVQEWLWEVIDDGRFDNVFGLRDRDLDYPNDEDIAHCYDKNEIDIKLFILRYRNLENYLVNAQLIFGFLKAFLRKKNNFKDKNQLHSELLKIGKQLKYITAANIVIEEHNKITPNNNNIAQPNPFVCGHILNVSNKEVIVKATARKLGITKIEVDRRISPKLEQIELIEGDLHELNKIIDGKRFLFKIREEFLKSKFNDNEFYNLLCDRIVQTKSIPLDIVFIVKNRILELE